jgi:hypothetical protein
MRWSSWLSGVQVTKESMALLAKIGSDSLAMIAVHCKFW